MTHFYENNRGQKSNRVGYIKDDNIFRKVVLGSKHQRLKPPSWGIDVSIYNDLVDKKIKEVRIKDEETGIVYKSTLQDWITFGITQNIGHGEQRFLLLQYFKTEGTDMSDFAQDVADFDK